MTDMTTNPDPSPSIESRMQAFRELYKDRNDSTEFTEDLESFIRETWELAYAKGQKDKQEVVWSHAEAARNNGRMAGLREAMDECADIATGPMPDENWRCCGYHDACEKIAERINFAIAAITTRETHL